VKKKIFSLLLVLTLSLCLAVPALAADLGLDAIVYDKVVNLENKDASWAIIGGDGIGAVFMYNMSGDTFDWSLDATGLAASEDYSLIYYADESNRFVAWGGDNPGALIANIKTGTGGNYVNTGSVDLGMPLPCSPDANIDEFYYGTASTCPVHTNPACTVTGDNYATGHGAKIWLVLKADYTAPELTGWNPASYLFETDLINYTDTNAIVSITVNPTSVDFGSVVAGATAGPEVVTVTNTGTVPVIVTAVAPVTGLFSNLMLNSGLPSAYSMPIAKTANDGVSLTLPVPVGYAPGSASSTLTFIATPATP